MTARNGGCQGSCSRYAVESVLPAWLHRSRLPQLHTNETPNVAKRWKDALGHLPD